MSESDITILGFLSILVLLFSNGFFVASEFALVRVRHTRLTQLANEGNKNAKIALEAVGELDKYIAATQLGITISSIGLGWLGEATLVKIILPIFDFIPWIDAKLATAHSISIAIAFSAITLLHVVIGELTPKSIALEYTEKTALFVARPMQVAANIFKPFIWILNGCGNAILKMLNIKQSQDHAHSTEELNMLIDESCSDGVINETEKDIIQNVFKFSDLTAKQVMVPKTDMTCIPNDISLDELKKITCESQYTRYPVYEEDMDNILGIIHIKDIYAASLKGEFDIEKILRKPMMVPETVSIDKLMRDFKEQQNQMAIVIDEFGGTSGLITLEDVLEEIFGEIQDEFDSDEEEDLIKISDTCYDINAMMRIDEVSEVLNVNIEDEDVDTIGGFVVKLLGRLAEKNDIVVYENLEFIVKEISKTRITKLRVNIIPKTAEEESLSEE
ncbi:MAG: hemolysin family protein [Candidatus Gastranaerophilales bacterium]|nr:hemolysin family protein [Candidatus Gastranaerophilales bacterium]